MAAWPDVAPWRGLDAFDRSGGVWVGDHVLAPLGPVAEPTPWPAAIGWPPGAPAGSEVVALDIETTGLGGAGSVAFQVGIAWRTADGGVHVRQLLAADFPEEAALLARLQAELESRPTRLVTYNGDAFDLPFLRTRARMHGQRLRLPPALDVLVHTRRLYRDRDGSCRLGHLEATRLGHARPDDLPGALVPQVYYEFLRRQEPDMLEPVLRHNACDLVATLGLLWQVALDIDQAPSPGRDSADLFGLYRSHLAAGDHAGAAASLEALVASTPPPALYRQALSRLSSLYRRLDQRERRQLLWQRAAEQPDAPPEHLVEWAKILEHERRDLAGAHAAAQAALARARALSRLLGAGHDRAGARAIERRIARLEHRMLRLAGRRIS